MNPGPLTKDPATTASSLGIVIAQLHKYSNYLHCICVHDVNVIAAVYSLRAIDPRQSPAFISWDRSGLRIVTVFRPIMGFVDDECSANCLVMYDNQSMHKKCNHIFVYPLMEL